MSPLHTMKIQDLVGEYHIIGTNQDISSNPYKGILSLKLDFHNRIVAKWIISDNQEQFGTGFFKNNILVINFNYKDDNSYVYKGVVVYQCLSNNILDGFWSEKHGNPLYLGQERCFKISHNKLLN
ncbi:conserved hypothetical protein [Tenacibaculum maritimum]|nr:conserved hypothetical protein [Tenacibaculum maritimum]CAA0232598.1 conserved hypothetical protein [Tenacibaculum maritimum]CAA0240231.1 conserved hypothetical protein [Tenacibaculum maritimum]CAA0242046.1 conserved hypothetical protein [Tenacibaculum maritimum]CAA0242649.1 conserved hypothetical protein [Tenacibaculum maritimum]